MMPALAPLLIRKILVPLDGSRLAEAALPAAMALGASMNALIVLLHVLERGAPASVHGDRHLQRVVDAEAYLDGIRTRLSDEGFVTESHVHPNLEADVANSIAGHAAELQADLIVCCTHGRGGPRDWVWGSMAQLILRRTEQPVLLVRPDAHRGEAPFALKSVVIALDGSPSAEIVLPAALAVCAATGAVPNLVVAIATLGTVGGDRAAGARLAPAATAAALELESENAQEYLRRLQERLRESGVEAGYKVVRGDPVEVALDLAGARPENLLALATHGRGRLEALWAGSVGGRVIARAAGPLLIARLHAPAGSA